MKVKSSQGGMVSVEVKGLAETIAFIRRKGKDIQVGSDLGTLKAANFVSQEVQESIIGNRPEPKSVATGRFANSITTDKIKDSEYKVYVEKSDYPEQPGTTTSEVALKLEYGTSKIAPRMHFRNSAYRSQNKAKEIINQEIQRKIK